MSHLHGLKHLALRDIVVFLVFSRSVWTLHVLPVSACLNSTLASSCSPKTCIWGYVI